MADASVVIVTRNRKEKARVAVESALAQTGADVEVVVMDDGSTDGTSEYLAALGGRVRLVRSEEQLGYIVHRTRSAEVVNSPVIVSIDDDAEFASATVVADTLKLFDDARVGAVAIPHENHRKDGTVHAWWPSLPDQNRAYVVNSFIGTAYAIRRDVFRELGGFQNYLFHWSEESEYCQRLYGAGYVVRLANCGLVRHYPEGAGKYTRTVNRYIWRNALLTVWLNAPALYVVPHMLGMIGRSMVRVVRAPGETTTVLEGTWMAVRGIFGPAWRMRKAISLRRYRAWLYVRKRRMVSMNEAVDRLGPVAQG